MTPPSPTIRLEHGTTLKRARQIALTGPDPVFREPGSERLPPAEGFSTALTDGRNNFTGTAREIAIGKAALFPNEDGPAILVFDLPVSILDCVGREPIGRGLLKCGEARFTPGYGLEELLAAWPVIVKRIDTL